MRVTYFANDLSDPALARRMRILRIGGADLRLLGFRRTLTPVSEVDGIPALDLGQTFAGRLADRCFSVFGCVINAARWQDVIADANVLLARNLEMATIADAVRVRSRSRARLAYECLDIHSRLLGTGVGSRLLRSWERNALRRSSALIVSSRDFIMNYFDRLGIALPDVILAENKLVFPDAHIDRPRCNGTMARPPWRIGWFGNLRCVASFRLMFGLAQSHPELVDIELRGRPTLELERLIAQNLPIENMRFAGPYASADLASVYSTRDFTWAIDYFQRGRNSEWLLPNRMCEGSFFNCPVIALRETATGAWLKARGAGVLLTDPVVELAALLAGLSPARYDALRRMSAAVPTRDLVWSVEDCRGFADQLAGN